MGEDEPGHKNCNEHIPIELWSAWQFQGYDEDGLLRSLNGRVNGVHKVLCSAAEIACKGRQDFYLGHDGGFMIPVHSELGHETRMHFEKLVNWYRRYQLIAVYIEDNIFNFCFSEEVNPQKPIFSTILSSREWIVAEKCARKSNENSEHGSGSQLGMTMSQLKRPMETSKWEMIKTKNHWEQRFQSKNESE